MRRGERLRACGRFLRRAETLAIVALTILLLLVYPVARDSGAFRAIEGRTLDWRFQARGAHVPAPEIVIVAIDEQTLAQTGRWPFSREWLARTVERLDSAGARTIVFDLLLTGAESSDPESPLGSPPQAPDGSSEAGGATDNDKALAAAIGRAGNVVVPYAFSFDRKVRRAGDLPPAVKVSSYRLVVKDQAAGNLLEPEVEGMLLPQMPFLAAGYPAHVSLFLEPDGTVRFAHPAMRFRDEYYPSVAIEAVRLFLGLDRNEAALHLARSVSLGKRRLPLDGLTGMVLNHAGPAGTFPRYSLADVATGKLKAGAFQGKLVLIGATATALGDRFLTPFSLRLPGVELVATMLDNVLAARPIKRGAAAEAWDIAAILAVGLLTLVLVGLKRAAAIGIAAFGLLAAWMAVTGYAFAVHLIWLNVTFPAILIIGAAAVAIAGRLVREPRLRARAERQRSTLSHYVSPLTSAGLAHADTMRGEGETTEAAVMFVDLVDYTQTSERMAVGRSAAMLRDFHEIVEREVSAFGGTIDKFMGDAAMAVFGVPVGTKADAANAIACARSLAETLRKRNEVAANVGSIPMSCGAGIHFGPVTLTELGGRMHRQITLTGDTVNIASRLEAMTREWGATIIASETVMAAAREAGAHEQVAGFELLPVRHIRGRSLPLKLWALGTAEEDAPAYP